MSLKGGVRVNREFSFTGLEPLYDWLMRSGIGEEIAEMLCELPETAAYLLIVLAAFAACVLAVCAVVMILLALVSFVSLLLWGVLYVLRAIGLSKIAKKLGVKHRFLAWIPYANAYLFGACAEASAKRDGKKPWKWSLILLLTTVGLGIGLPLVQVAIYAVLTILSLPLPFSVACALVVECATVVLVVLTSCCLWRICRQFMDEPLAIILAVLAPFCGELISVLLFVVGCLKLRRARMEEMYEVPEDAYQEVRAEDAAKAPEEEVDEVSEEETEDIPEESGENESVES